MAYSQKVVQRFEDVLNNPSAHAVGRFDPKDPNVATGMVGAPACGDVMQLRIRVENGIIEDAKFKTYGCGSAIASSSLLTEWVKGKNLEEAGLIKNMDIANELALPPVKIHCSILAEDAIKAAIEDYKNNFDYKKYLKEGKLFEDLPKGKWVDLNDIEQSEYAENIFDLIKTAYASIGGHSNYQSSTDVVGSEGDADYEVINLDDDPDIEAVSVSKLKSAGDKFVATGHDGSKIAKSAVVNHKADQLKSGGYYVEVSGKIKDIFKAKGVEPINDEELVRKVLKGKEIEWLGNGEYKRTIGGKEFTKALMGKPTV